MSDRDEPVVIASSVIRSSKRGDSHGGLYVIDFNKETIEQKLDWDYPEIRWDSGGGDRGLRGMAFWGDYLYAAGATYLYKFNKNFELVDKFNNPNFDGTHEVALYKNDLYCISNSFDAILKFNLETQEFDWGMQHNVDPYHHQDEILEFDPRTHNVDRHDDLHLDSVSIKEEVLAPMSLCPVIVYAGSTTTHIYKYCPEDKDRSIQKLFHRNTHNAQFIGETLIAYNRSLESQTCIQDNQDRLLKQWNTPLMQVNSIPGDYARIGYTRGMVFAHGKLVVGTSPAAVHMYDVFQETETQPMKSAVLSRDIRNSVCGLAKYEWGYE